MNWLRNLIGLPEYDPTEPLGAVVVEQTGAADDEPAGLAVHTQCHG